MKKILFLFAIIVVLFISSGQTYEQQSLIPTLQKWLPNRPFESLLSLFHIPYWGTVVSVEERGYYHFIEFLIRKGAHIVSFGILSIAFYYVLPVKRHKFVVAFLLTAAYAIFDEYRQSLTGGRTPYFGDVLLDSAGALLALLVLWIVKNRTASR